MNMSVSNKIMAEVFRADTFLVISEDNSVEAVVEYVMNVGGEFGEEVVMVGRIDIEIESEDLMIFSDDTGFSGSRVVGEYETARIDVQIEE